MKQRLLNDFKEAMKNKQTVRKNAITMLRAAIKQKEVETRQDVTEEDILSIIQKQIKEKKKALVDFEAANREDLLEEAKAEIAVLEAYLPKQLNEDEISEVVDRIIEESGASSMKDMGRVMSKAKEKIGGRADGATISTIVKKKLGN